MVGTLYRFTILCLALLLAGNAYALTSKPNVKNSKPLPIAEIPISIINNRIEFELLLGSSPLTILLDTGASSTIFFQSEALKSLPSKANSQTSISFPAISRSVLGYRLNPVALHNDEFEFIVKSGLFIGGDASIINQLEASYDVILGREFFRNFAVEIDPAAKLMRLYPPGSNLKPYFDISQRLYMESDMPYIRFFSQMPWEQRPTSKALLLDTGYPGSLVLWNKRHFRQAKKHGQMVKKNENSAGIVSYIKLTFGDLSFENIPVFIARIIPGQPSKRDGLIGSSILAQYRHVIDFAQGSLLMSPIFGRSGKPLQIIDGQVYTPNNEIFDVKTFYPKIPTVPTLIIYANGSHEAK